MSLRRLVVIWLLLLALPLQALAASQVGDCHGGTAGPASHGMATMAPHDDAAPPCHDDPPADACSVCAACCLAVVLPAVLAAPAGAGAHAAPRAVAPGDLQPAPLARLERPPRTAHIGQG
jgi:hypothetical protein